MSYLECYLGLMDDNQRCVLEDEPLPHHLVTRVEELIHHRTVSLKHAVIFLHQRVKGGLDDVVLVEVGSVDARASLLHA
jgi:hypothetical protein